MRVCNVPGCGTLLRADDKRGKCDTHRREYDRAQGSATQRGYGSAHQRMRAAWQQIMDAGKVLACWRCGMAIDPANWHLGHDDRDRGVYRGPECPRCNLATAGRRA